MDCVISLDDLNDPFRGKMDLVIAGCKGKGIVMHPYCVLRDVWEQARLWRQSRSWFEIKKAIMDLRSGGAHWIAEVLEGVGPQYGRWATNALPGESWHQYGAAVDCFVLEDKRAVWDSSHRGYAVYASEAMKLDLGVGYYWRYPDPVHVQQFRCSVTSSTDWPTINDMMYKRWGLLAKKNE